MNSTQLALPQNVEREERKRLALQLRGGGAKYWQIAEQLQCSTANAHVLVIEALEELHVKTQESAEQLRALELARCDEMLAALNARKDSNTPRAIDTKLRIMDMRAKLTGIYAPVELSGSVTVVPGAAGIDDPREKLKLRIAATAKLLEAGKDPKDAVAEAVAEPAAPPEVTAAEIVPSTTPTNGNHP